MEHFLDHYGYAAIFLVAVIEAVCIPFPSEITFGYPAALVAQHETHLSVVGVIAIAIVGEICGCVIAYVIGRSGGRAVVDRYGKYLLLSHRDLDKADDFMAKRGLLSVFFGRFIPVVRAIISLVAGIGEMNFGQFLASTSAATIIYGIALGSIGYELGHNWHKIVKGFTYAGAVVALIAIAAIVLAIVHRVRVLRSERGSVG
jgi:membrane protein DedA with SNARE-associated domain